MFLERVYDEPLAQAAYVVACDHTGLALVIDTNRDVESCLRVAEHKRFKIVAATETHIHADFVSGTREMARRTGARLLLSGEGGPDWQYAFAKSDSATLLRHGDSFDVGMLRFDVRHTPGHTPEHLSFVVTDRAMSDRPVGIFTGDFIFVGDVGRPDLLERAAKQQGTMDGMARRLFQSVQATSDLPDYLQLWPGHGAGSACGKELGALPSTTLGFERIANWAFQFHDENSFVDEVLSGQSEPPGYFARMKTVNRAGPTPFPVLGPLREVGGQGIQDAFHTGITVVDVRSSADFAAGHIPGTLSIPMGTSLAMWAGTFVDPSRDILLLADDNDRLERSRHTLALIGLDRVIGWGGRRAREEWQSEVGELERVEQVSVEQVANDGERTVIDVRGNAEWEEGHLPNARHYFLGDLVRKARDLAHDTPIVVHCHGGTRASVAASLLQAQGFTNVANISGGYRAWTEARLPVEQDEAPAKT
jgi:hydroxyacylglutathione hydrolase